jgi:Fe-S-cluster containining protein
MIGELYDKLPVEMVWNILKFSVHPCAEIMKKGFNKYPYMRCGLCCNVIFWDNHKWEHIGVHVKEIDFYDGILCGRCCETHDKHIRRAIEAQYEEYLDEQRVDNFDDYDED